MVRVCNGVGRVGFSAWSSLSPKLGAHGGAGAFEVAGEQPMSGRHDDDT